MQSPLGVFCQIHIFELPSVMLNASSVKPVTQAVRMTEHQYIPNRSVHNRPRHSPLPLRLREFPTWRWLTDTVWHTPRVGIVPVILGRAGNRILGRREPYGPNDARQAAALALAQPRSVWGSRDRWTRLFSFQHFFQTNRPIIEIPWPLDMPVRSGSA